MDHKSHYIILFVAVFLFILVSCNNKETSTKNTTSNFSETQTTNSGSVRKIFYNMYLPTEMTRVFAKTGANYDPSILNSADHFSRYQREDQIAVNLGIYGVDMGYTQLFDQNTAMAKYFSTIQIMAEKLGIPDDEFNDLLAQLENAYDDKDSLSAIALRLYQRTDSFLKTNGHNTNAALIVFGGWIEALYIASKIYENNPENLEILDRIAEQKYSLNSLISLLSNYQESMKVAEYILMLKQLKSSFEKFEIYYEHDNVRLDTVNKTIAASDYKSGMSPEIAQEINKIVSEIRLELIN